VRIALFFSLLVLAEPSGVLAQARPVSPRALRSIETAEAYLAAGDRGSAIGHFRDAIAADPFAGRAYEGLAGAYLARGSLEEARATYEAGIVRAPEHAPLWLGLTRTLLALGADRDASRALREYLGRAPGDRDALMLQAELARRRGAWSEALTTYRVLLTLELDDAQRTEARRYEAALRLLAQPLDPVSSARACAGSDVRRALARCR
jgi:tetratricopeptide (TPR) repeat protein